MAAKQSRSIPILVVFSLLLGAPALLAQGVDAAMALTLTSPAFDAGAPIPSIYTCEGKDISPPLAWDSACRRERRVVLILDDPDAPDPKAPRRVWVHWVLYNICPRHYGSRRKCRCERPARRYGAWCQRLQKGGLQWSVPANRQASVLSQTLCARHHVRSGARDQGRARSRDERPCARRIPS